MRGPPLPRQLQLRNAGFTKIKLSSCHIPDLRVAARPSSLEMLAPNLFPTSPPHFAPVHLISSLILGSAPPRPSRSPSCLAAAVYGLARIRPIALWLFAASSAAPHPFGLGPVLPHFALSLFICLRLVVSCPFVYASPALALQAPARHHGPTLLIPVRAPRALRPRFCIPSCLEL